MWRSLLFGARRLPDACLPVDDDLDARPWSPSIVGSTFLSVCTSSKNRRVTFSYQTVNSAWPCVGSSGPVHLVVLASRIIACSSSTGAWTSSALYQRSARSSISSLVSGSLNSSSLVGSTSEPSCRRPGGGSPRPRRGRALPGAAAGRSGTGRPRRVPRSIAGATSSGVSTRVGGHAHALGELVEADHRVAEVERAREGVVGEAALLPVLLHVQLRAAGSCGCCRRRTSRRSRGAPPSTSPGSCTSRRRRR